MVFKKGHTLGAKRIGTEPLTHTVAIRVTQATHDRLKSVPDWRERLKAAIAQIASEAET